MGGQKSATKKPNPFDLKSNNVKFPVLNKRQCGTKGAPLRSKKRAEEIREKSLLPEMQKKGHSSLFVDRRFGQKDGSLSVEDKMQERYTRERKRMAGRTSTKRSVFNLEDEEEMELTHGGRPLENLGDAELREHDREFAISDLEEEDEGREQFGNFDDGDEDTKKTKNEVMREIIAKSKFHKFERQKVKEKNEELVDELDAAFPELRRELAGHQRSEVKNPAPDSYDALVKQMAFDRRSRPTDRTKTQEELEEERRSKLEFAGKRQRGENEEDKAESSHGPRLQPKLFAQAQDALDEFLNSKDSKTANSTFLKLHGLANTRGVIELSYLLRQKLGEFNQRFKNEPRPFYPSLSDILVFKLIGTIYSTSDRHHIIATPAKLLVISWLTQGRMTRPRHLFSALFLAHSLVDDYEDTAKRYSPELILLINYLLSCFSGLPLSTPAPMANLKINRDLQGPIFETQDTLEIADFVDVPSVMTDEIRSKIFSSLISLVKKTLQLYASLPSFYEIFGETGKHLNSLQMCENTKTLFKALFTTSFKQRQPLVLQKHKPISIPQLTPQIESHDREESETRRLKAAYKREFKGAKRELARDSSYIATKALEERKRKDVQYKEMINKIVGTIGNDSEGVKAKKRKF